MFADDIRRALPGTPRERLAELSAAVWKGFACGAVSEEDAQGLAEEIAAHKAVPAVRVDIGTRRRVGSRPRSPAAMERRRRWTSSGWLPPQLAARFTMGETAALSAIAAEVARRGLCRLTIGHIAALAGVGRTTVQNAVRQAVALGILTSEEWRLSAWRSAPNTVRIISPEWRAWLKMRDRKRAGDHPRQAESTAPSISGAKASASKSGLQSTAPTTGKSQAVARGRWTAGPTRRPWSVAGRDVRHGGVK
ncbi:hypothetical protein [Lichenibacterium dinghuense]|uniref:hypothetical protein n=1 Tax=Lichenibacterium dinghuense TaxID=2895977 RepID=UPI001F2078FB|nr:hypothetical protein [Lichenibacterium sp. 6Y81]